MDYMIQYRRQVLEGKNLLDFFNRNNYALENRFKGEFSMCVTF